MDNMKTVRDETGEYHLMEPTQPVHPLPVVLLDFPPPKSLSQPQGDLSADRPDRKIGQTLHSHRDEEIPPEL